SNAALDVRILWAVDRHERHGTPGGLAGGGGAGAHEAAVLVGVAGLAEGAILLLDALEPAAGLLHPGDAHVLTDRFEAAHHLPRAVDVVHAPAAEPAAFRLLAADDEADGPLHRRVVGHV